MKIDEIKKKMMLYVDYHGCNLIARDEISKAKTREDLKAIIWLHRRHLQSIACDAEKNLDSFERELGLHTIV